MQHQLTITREFNLPVKELFAAWASAEAVSRWFAPGEMTVPEAQVNFIEGGRYRIVMQNEEGEQHIVVGTYQQIEPHSWIAFTWQWEGSELVTSVELRLRELAADRSELKLVHNAFPDSETRDKHQQGWMGCLANLTEECAA